MVNAFSFCLYGGENPKYYQGLLENIALIGKYFPAWKVYVYYAPDVTDTMINHLAACTSVVLRPTGEHGAVNMIHRFYAIDEPDVNIMMVRDADSRVHWKDRWAIRKFVESEYNAHTIRDNVEHTACMMGGLWGIKKTAGINMYAEYEYFKNNPNEKHGMGHDQNFLQECIYPKVRPTLLVHYSNGRARLGEIAVEFPFDWTNDVYCGRIELEYLDYPEPPIKRAFGFPTALVRVRDAISAPVAAPAPPPEPVLPTMVPTPNLPILNFLHRK
jgi:hypothetical protein